LQEINKDNKSDYKVAIKGDLDPASRFVMRELMKRYGGDWVKVMDHVRVVRVMLVRKRSNRDRYVSSRRMKKIRTLPN
jgi:serine protein kinase